MYHLLFWSSALDSRLRPSLFNSFNTNSRPVGNYQTDPVINNVCEVITAFDGLRKLQV